MSIASFVIRVLASRAKAFEESTKDPVKAQAKTLFEYLARNRKTEYGAKYNFSAIKSIGEYQAKVPMSDCESVRPYIERMAKGERNILVSDRVLFFGLTSGTTGQPKLIPATKYSQARKTEVTDLWTYYITRDHPNLVKGKILAVISPEIEGITEAGIPYGAETGHGYENLPPFVKKLYVLPHQVFNITDYDARYYCILRMGMEHNVRTIASLNPSTIILLCQKIEKWGELIIDDIDKGTLDESFDIPKNIRDGLAKHFRPNPERARRLKEILREKKGLLPKWFWPDLELIECWKAGTVNLYLKELPKYFGNIPVRDFGCLSTEARSSVPMSDEGAVGVLAIGANFYEFVPKEDMDKSEKRFLLCNEVEKGKEYFLVVTTPAGLYRYNIDDIIRVTSFFNRTPMIEFVQKGLHAYSITGEKLYEAQLNTAVNKAAEKNKVALIFFSAFPEERIPPRYVFLVEFSTPLSRDKKRDFLRSIEQELCLQNAEYRDIRRSQVLAAPLLKVVAEGEFEKYRAKRIEEGSLDGQFKMPQLVKDPDFEKNFAISEEIAIN